MNIFWLASRKRECFRDAFFRARGTGGGRHGYSGNPGDTGLPRDLRRCRQVPRTRPAFSHPSSHFVLLACRLWGADTFCGCAILTQGLHPVLCCAAPTGLLRGKGSPLVKSRSDESRAALSGYVTDTMWYIVSTLCGGETVIYG